MHTPHQRAWPGTLHAFCVLHAGFQSPVSGGGTAAWPPGLGEVSSVWDGREMDRWTWEAGIRRSPYCSTPSSHWTPALSDPRAPQWPGRALVHHPRGREGGRAWALGSSQPWPRMPPDPGQRTHTSKAVMSSQASPAGSGDQGLLGLETHISPPLPPPPGQHPDACACAGEAASLGWWEGGQSLVTSLRPTAPGVGSGFYPASPGRGSHLTGPGDRRGRQWGPGLQPELGTRPAQGLLPVSWPRVRLAPEDPLGSATQPPAQGDPVP